MAQLSSTNIFGSLTVSGTATINTSLNLGAGSATTGSGLFFKTSVTPAPTGTTNTCYDGYFYATRVYNAVWNDVADFIDVPLGFIVEYGKAYTRDSITGEIRLTKKRGEKTSLGIASDTYGFGVGQKEGRIPMAIGGFVLAYVDQIYPPGTPLTTTKNGGLTKARLFFDQIIARFDRTEIRDTLNNIVKVNGRHWVRVC